MGMRSVNIFRGGCLVLDDVGSLPSQSVLLLSTNIVVWNSRGSGCPKFHNNVKGCTKFQNNVTNLKQNHKMEILAICEHRISGTRAFSMVKS